MDKKLIALAVVAALAVPTAAIAAQHGSHSRSKSTASAPRTKAKGSTSRSGLAVRFKQRAAELVEDGRLDETFVNATCDPPETFSFGGVLAHVLTFAAHRRTLVTGALISAGVDVDLVTADPRAWLSDN